MPVMCNVLARRLDRHNTIGVDPEQRGRGLGQPLMARVLEVADAEEVACYLESSNPRNLSFYERLGFEVLEEVTLPNGPTIRPMWRSHKADRWRSHKAD